MKVQTYLDAHQMSVPLPPMHMVFSLHSSTLKAAETEFVTNIFLHITQ